MKKVIIFVVFASYLNCFSQNDSTEISDKVKGFIHNSWLANQAPSYLSIVPFIPSINERRIPLIQGEGEDSKFNLMEANINLTFPLLWGRQKGKKNKKYFNYKHQLNLDYNGTFRMTLDNSKPLTPGNNKVGLRWNCMVYNSYTRWIWKSDEDADITEIRQRTNHNFKFLNFMFQAHHFSNGQAPGFYHPADENNLLERRNSYLDGDFSTNYLYFQLTHGWYQIKAKSLHQISFGFRRDFGKDEGSLSFSKEQLYSYGKNRWLLKYDYRTAKDNSKMLLHGRVELEYIVGPMDNFVPNLILDPENDSKYRLGIKGLFELSPYSHRAIGYFVSVYYGRDYLNIRYDDIIYSTQLGITLSLEKFLIPKLNP